MLAKIAILVFIILFIQKRPRGMSRSRAGRLRALNAHPLIRLLDRGAVLFLVLLGAFAIAYPGAQPAGAVGIGTPTFRPIWCALFGKYICYGLLALSIDLIWGYVGILSLGHGAFFALGGYAWACT